MRQLRRGAPKTPAVDLPALVSFAAWLGFSLLRLIAPRASGCAIAGVMSALLIDTPLYFYVFAVLTVAGGVLGYVKAKSTPSIVAGSIAGGLLAAAAWSMQNQGRPGVLLGLVVSVLLLARFGRAFAKTKKPMPAGLMTALSLIGIVLTVLILVGR